MKYVIAAMVVMCGANTSFALDRPKFTTGQLEALDQRDADLSEKIVGAWLFETMGDNFVHVAQRTIYKKDGTFVSDYRISSAGEINYRRATGIWFTLMGWFCEEETQSTDGQLIPRMVRWVDDPIGKELKTTSRTGVKAVLVRGDSPAKDFDYSLKGLSEKELCSSLLSEKMLGFIAEETGEKDADGNSLCRWILKSRLIEIKDPSKKK